MREPLLTPRFVLVAVAHFAHALSFYLFLHLPAFLQGLGASEIHVGLLYGATSATAILARPLIGRVMDERGRRPIALAGGVIGVISSAAYLAVDRLGALVWAVRIAHGMAEAMLFASLFAIAADMVPPSRRIEGIGLFGVSGLLPMAIGGALGDAALQAGGYRALFVMACALSVTGFALSLAIVEPPRAEGAPPRGLATAFADRALAPLWISGMCFATAIAAYFTFLKTYLTPHPALSVGSFFSTYAAAAIVLRVAGGRLPERLGPRRVLAGAFVLLASGLVLLALLPPSQSALWAAGLLCGAGHGYAFPVMLGLVVSRARPTERGAALAIYTALFDAGTLVGAPILGAIAERVGYAPMFFTASGIVVSGLVMFGALESRRPAVSA